ncbi:MAG: sulfatase-like hydrolase/transferase [Planctomycetaceae bacterium]|nr:sulfatase-like hydrolase/transferase [Planctomycetaceae bacterium]
MNRVLLILFGLSFISAADAKPPNILYFYVDDMGWGSIGPNGQSERRAAGLANVQTPNLDRLAKQGVNFTRGYGCHVCSPARASQQTGFHQGHTFADRNDPDNAKKAMRRDDVTIGDALSAAGYATGYWGKWGFGGSKDPQNPVVVNVQTLPTSHGYQDVLAELHHVRAHTFFQPTLWRQATNVTARGGLDLVPNTLTSYRGNAAYPNLPARQNHADYPATAYCDDSYAFAAFDFVRRQAQQYQKTGQPFFGLLAVQVPHAPFDEITRLPDWDAAYADDPHFASLDTQSRQWAAMVTRIDSHIGNILAALEDPNGDGDLSDSVARETLVVFQSDNGGPRGSCLKELDSNGGLRGTKGTIYEGGIRVPLIMRWPAKINGQSERAAGSVCDQVVDVTDLLPTFCELAGAEVPLGIDGVSIAEILVGQEVTKRRDFIIHEASNQASIIRGNQKLIRNARGKTELYDLSLDPSESHDLSQSQPKLVREMEALLLGERVTEKKGFAVTYHQWMGKDGDSAGEADHWSPYRYENEGIIYQTDDGAPQLAWIAKMENTGTADSLAVAERNLHVLALEIRGRENARQLLGLQEGIELVGRNEIRIGPFGTIDMHGARIASMRAVDVLPLGTLLGKGEVDATLRNGGYLVIQSSAKPLHLIGDYRQHEQGLLAVEGPIESPGFVIDGIAELDGKLEFRSKVVTESPKGTEITVLTAKKVKGKFSNPDDLVSNQGRQWQIRYGSKSVSLIAR